MGTLRHHSDACSCPRATLRTFYDIWLYVLCNSSVSKSISLVRLLSLRTNFFTLSVEKVFKLEKKWRGLLVAMENPFCWPSLIGNSLKILMWFVTYFWPVVLERVGDQVTTMWYTAPVPGANIYSGSVNEIKHSKIVKND